MNLLAALPNCARIGFTGTPIIMGAKKKTTDIFGAYIDIYRLADAERDGAVVPILYAGRTVKGAVRDGRDLDEVFEDMFADHTPEELEEIQRRYATKGDVLDGGEADRRQGEEHLAALCRDGAARTGSRRNSSPTTGAPRCGTGTRCSAPATSWSPRSRSLPERTRNADPDDLKPTDRVPGPRRCGTWTWSRRWTSSR